ncbi:MAG TPA: PPC domain-containing protein [Kofleriaceae bacterium]|nr:PPC domain-containing protein [Kofleriaceae bacterium]
MRSTRRHRHTILGTLLVVLASACGGGDDGSSSPPDAAPQVDAPPIDAGPTCTALVPMGGFAFDAADASDTSVSWAGKLTTDLGGGGDSLLQLEFYDGIEASLTGPIDLSMGNQSNYETCAACIRAFALDAEGSTVTKQWFQDGGTINLTMDPITQQVMVGSLTDVSLVEVTIDDQYHSTPVEGGTCLSIPNLSLDADSVPLDWTCAKPKYHDGATCDCACGAHDPDCDTDTNPVAGCTGSQVCSADVCTDTCDVLSTPPVGCPAGAFCAYDNDSRDLCYTDQTLVDPAAQGATCAAGPVFCAVSNTVATGVCDVFAGDDEICRKACDATGDCGANQLCQPIAGLTAKGLCINKVANDTCQDATMLTLGTGVDGTTGGATANYAAGLETADCTGFTQSGADVAYKVTLAAGTTYTIALSNVTADFDPSVSIAGPGTAAAVCDAATISCLAGADAGITGDAESFMYTPAAAGTYYIIVDSFDATQEGGFTLTVTAM